MHSQRGGGFFVACDIDPEQTVRCRKNADFLESYLGSAATAVETPIRCRIGIDVVLADAARSPFRQGVFDTLVSDVPFGKRHSTKKYGGTGTLYRQIANQWSHMLRPTGSATALVLHRKPMRAAFEPGNGETSSLACWQFEHEHQ